MSGKTELERVREVEKLVREENARLRLELQTAKYDASLAKDKLVKSQALVTRLNAEIENWKETVREQSAQVVELTEEVERLMLRETLRGTG